MLLEGEEALQLTRGEANDYHPAWSPDGTRIAFLRETDDGAEVRTIPVLGGTDRVLTTTRRAPAGLDWSPDGQWIAFSDQASPDDPPSIFMVSTESGGRRKLTSPPAEKASLGDIQPIFSPDGKTVAFIRERRGGGGVGSLFVKSVDSGPARAIHSPDFFVWDVDWTRDGRSLVFSTGKTFATSYLARVPISGGQPERLSIGDRARYLSISRPGGRLVYSQWLQDHNIWRAPGPTSNDKNAPQPFVRSTRDEAVGRYSPDGTRIAFVSDRSGTWEVWTCDSDSANPGRLTDLGHAIRPSWSPDGRQIIFSSVAEGTSDVYSIASSGGFPKNLTADTANYRSAIPSWSRDGSWFYYQSNQGGRVGVPWQVWKRPLNGGEPVQLTRNGGMRPQESDDGRLFFFRGEQIWTLADDGGEPRLVLDQRVRFSTWCLWRDSIIYLNEEISLIEAFHRPTQTTTELLNLEPFPRPQMATLAVSPDGQWVLYTRLDAHGSDLMRVENFR
jgi:Tol biopolymer transport system component